MIVRNENDGFINNSVNDVFNTFITDRRRYIEQFLDPRRDIAAECGLPTTYEMDHRYYRELYDRNGIATRVVEIYPEECWKVQPTIYETEDVDVKTEFETAWDDLCKNLRSGIHESWFAPNEDEGNPIWSYLKRADILSGIGTFGVILLGLDDGQPLNTPAPGFEEVGSSYRAFEANQMPYWSSEKKQWLWKTTHMEGYWKEDTVNDVYNLNVTPGKLALNYMRVFDESLVDVTIYENNPTSPRYGFPVMYRITLSDPYERHSGVGFSIATLDVHWSRVIHVADNLTNSEIFGVPRLRPVYDYCYGLYKLINGSVEMYWRGAFPGISIETHPQLGGDVNIDVDATRSQVDDYFNRLQRSFITVGSSVKTLSPNISDPTSQFNMLIDALCVKLGIPVRIFKGSERGELSSNQDASTWDERLKSRMNGYLTPRLIVQFVDRLIQLGVLPQPVEGYKVHWPDLTSMSESERASLAESRTRAFAQYVAGDVGNLIHPVDYLVGVHGIPEQEVSSWINRMEEIEASVEGTTERSKLLDLVGGVTGMAELFRIYSEGAVSRETLVQIIMLFYGQSQQQAEQIVADSEAGAMMQAAQPFGA